MRYSNTTIKLEQHRYKRFLAWIAAVERGEIVLLQTWRHNRVHRRFTVIDTVVRCQNEAESYVFAEGHRLGRREFEMVAHPNHQVGLFTRGSTVWLQETTHDHQRQALRLLGAAPLATMPPDVLSAMLALAAPYLSPEAQEDVETVLEGMKTATPWMPARLKAVGE